VRAFRKEADDPSFGVIGFEQEAAVAEFAFDVCSGVLAGHSKFLSAVWALQQESLGFDMQEAIVWGHGLGPCWQCERGIREGGVQGVFRGLASRHMSRWKVRK
jgi:hypothetical protein